MFKSTSQLEFNRMFKNEQDCYEYLNKLRWAKGFRCAKCGSDKYRSGNKKYDRRCVTCGTHHSLTAHTLFHKLKFSILKAFHIAFSLSSKKGISTCEIAKRFEINQKTAWLFKRKFQEAIKTQNEKLLLSQDVEVDEFVVGGMRKQKRGRSLEKKKGVMIMIEKVDNKRIGNIKLEKINSFTKKELKSKMSKNIKDGAKIKADKYPSYESMKTDQDNFVTIYSDSGKNFQEIHQTIANFKSWLRGIHHKASDYHFQNYLNEFCFRHNNRNYEKGIFNNIIFGFLHSKKAYRSSISNVSNLNH
jgi:hypothetical protein